MKTRHDPVSLIERQRHEFAALKALRQDPTPQNKARWAGICRDNLQFVHAYVQAQGWPPSTEVDDDGENAAFLMAQHGDAKGLLGVEWSRQAAKLQQDILQAMRRQPQANSGYIAFLTDRILYNKEQPQLYGTVPDPHYPVEHPKGLEERRAQAGLKETQAEYLLRMGQGDRLPYRKIIGDAELLKFWDEEEKESDTITHGKRYDLREIIRVAGAVLGLGLMIANFPFLGLAVIFTGAIAAPVIANKIDDALDARDALREKRFADRNPAEPSLTPAHYHHKPDYRHDPDHPTHPFTILGKSFGGDIKKQREEAAERTR